MNLNTPIKSLLLVAMCLSLNACASGARSTNMVAAPDESFTIDSSNKYYKAISVQSVSGGKETNPMLMSKVDNTAFQEALELSLAQYGMLSDQKPGAYTLDANLLALEQPVFGFTFNVDSVAQYNLKQTSNGAVIMDDTIKATGTAKVGDAFIGSERLRIANENAMKENIKAFINKILGR